MLADVTLWAWIGATGMLAGTLPSLWLWYLRPSEATYYATLAGVTGIAAVAYVLMAVDVGNVATPGGTLPTARYVDWLLTTPLLIAYLALLARTDRRTLAALIAVDVVVIAGGIVAVTTTGTVSWVAFAVAFFAYLGLVYGLLVNLPRSAAQQVDRVRAVFYTLRNITVVLWTLYPIAWLLAPTGFGLLTPATEMLVFVYLDLVSKVGFAIVAVAGADSIARLEEDLERDSGREADPDVAPTSREVVEPTD